MKNLALARIQAMKPYNPPLTGRSDYDGLLLDFNERTMSFDRSHAGKMRLYPEYFDLESRIAAYTGADSGQVMVTNGTDQAINIIFRTFADVDNKVIIPEPSFAMYRQYAQITGSRIVSPLYDKADLAFPLKEVLAAIDDKTRVIVVCNPNNPTGTLLPVTVVAKIAARAKNAVVYVDEAYFEFSGCSAVKLVKKYPNVIVSRTFSKAFGLAGFRLGYVVADKRYITEMLKIRGPYDVNRAAVYAATAALANIKDTRAYADEVMDKAKPLVERFFASAGIKFYPSAGNFVLFRPEDSDKVFRILRRTGILLRSQDKPNIKGTLRLTVGTVAQMKKFIQTYQATVIESGAQKYAFLDRDGTLICEPPDAQVDSLSKLRLLDGVIDGLKKLQSLGYGLVMVTNQDGLGTPAFPLADFRRPQRAMLKAFKAAGIKFDAILICPHSPKDRCRCRKPGTALVDDFLRGRTIDKKQTFVCGDRPSDKHLAENLGLKFVPMPKNGNFYQAIRLVIKGADNEK